jgi:fluoroquinolone transport system ATP-binding protein
MIVSARNLRFRYPRSAGDVLHGLDFDIAEGEIFGFLGPNGSGKSTTQKILTGILPAYRGAVQVFGHDVGSQRADYYNRIGVSFEFPNLFEKLTAEENLAFYRGFFDVPTDEPGALLRSLDLPVGDRRPVAAFSKGMKMRLVLARSLINRPKLWFLDEPTTGQDPHHAVAIRDLIRAQADSGVTVFLTTHDMTVADKLCDRVALIDEGRLPVVDAPRALKLQFKEPVVRVEHRAPDGSLERKDFRLDDAISKHAFLEMVRTTDVQTIHTQEPSLEDVFLRLTGKALV